MAPVGGFICCSAVELESSSWTPLSNTRFSRGFIILVLLKPSDLEEPGLSQNFGLQHLLFFGFPGRPPEAQLQMTDLLVSTDVSLPGPSSEAFRGTAASSVATPPSISLLVS